MNACPTCRTPYPANVRLCPKDGAVLESRQPTEQRLVGVVLDGKYRLDSHLSSGGMGVVFRATHVLLGKPVAVKLIKADDVPSAEMVRRFQREARAATHLSHPSIVGVYDLGQTDDGTLYIAMELVGGRSLKDEIRQHGRIDPPRVVALTRQIASALAVAHRSQVIHRDLKPQNVMLTEDAEGRELAKLLDFGIAKTFDEGATQLTAGGFALGTPHYMSPEQATAGRVDGRSDIYSLGVMVYEMLTGDVPFNDPSTPAILMKHMTEPPAPFSAKRPDLQLPRELEAIALKCLEKEPGRRFQTAEELVAALDACARTMPASASPANVAVPLPGSDDVTMPTPSAAAAMPPAHRTVAAADGRAIVAGSPEADFKAKPGSSFGAILGVAAVVLLLVGLAGAAWIVGQRGFREPAGEAVTGDAGSGGSGAADGADARQSQGEDTEADAAQSPASPPAVLTPHEPPVPPDPPARGAAGSALPGADRGAPARVPPAAGAPSGAPGTGGSAPTAPPAPSPGTAIGPPPEAEPARPVLPAQPSVFVQCRGDAEACGAIRAAFDQALQRERLPIARSSDRADVVLVATASAIGEQQDRQFDTPFTVRTYSIEVLGDAPRVDRVVPMGSPRTFSFDTRLGRERLAENARVVAMDAVGRVVAFVKQQE